MKSLARRLERVEARLNQRPQSTAFAIEINFDTTTSEEQINSAIAAHGTRTGYDGAVVLVSPKLSQEECYRRYALPPHAV
jgi:hypothetical protein